MACRLCERIKNIRAVDVILIIFICVGMYIANHFQMKSYYKERAEKLEQAQKEEKQKLKAFEDLQRQCYFKQDKKACEELEKM